MKIIKLITIIFVISIITIFKGCSPVLAASRTSPLIIDNTSVSKFNLIPSSVITTLTTHDPSKKLILLRHASIGSNISGGLDTLFADNLHDRYNFVFQARGNPGWQAKVDDFVTQTEAQLNNFDIFTMKFCYIDNNGDPTTTWNYYRDKMLYLEQTYPSKTFVWWTMPLMTTGNANRDGFNTLVRNFTKTNNKILFDIAAIESNGKAVINGGYEAMDASYSSDGGHLNAIGAGLIAKAFWVMMAEIYSPPNTYYVSTTGNDTTNPGTQTQPWKTIQKCLNVVVGGDTCLITEGTYNEALTLKTSGTATARMTLKNYNNQIVTVNSGTSKTIITGGRVDYYTIDGLRLIASFTPSDQSDVSIDLGKNVPFSTTNKANGNHGFIIKNCYIEGAIHFYGHNNLMENCELNGKNIWQNGVIDNFAASHDNIYRNNKISNFIVRGIWSMALTDNILVEGNTIHDVQHGADCDGAGQPVSRCKVINNHIYNNGINQWGSGIFLENCFNCVIDGNIIHDIQTGPGIFIINYGNGSTNVAGDWHTFNNIEYRNQNTNTNITNNVIYNYHTDSGISIKAVNGLTIDHNTIYHTGACVPSTAVCPAIGLNKDNDDAGVLYCSQNETIINNIFFKNVPTWFCTPTVNNTMLGNFTSDPLFVNPPIDLHLKSSSPACTVGVNGTYAGAFPCGIVITPTSIPSLCQPLGDIDCSGKVNILDLSALLAAFGSTTNKQADLDNSGKVNMIDLSILLSYFGK